MFGFTKPRLPSEGMMKFELEKRTKGLRLQDDELLEDLRRCAKAIGGDTIETSEYDKIGKAHSCTFRRRFGSWRSALERAGLQPGIWRVGITDEALFENIRSLWMSLGRQPRRSELGLLGSQFSGKPYAKRFGSWSKALKEFVAWVNSDSPEEPQQDDTEANQPVPGSLVHAGPPKRRTRREPSDRQRFRVLVRDGFRCRACGASPLTQVGGELHVNHVLPWSKGGETTDDNLQTKCERCNLGKSNAFNV
ncbi:MAG: HNH endonuclease [Pirellulales bacterium]|nr:HNH endonuclease [Pirellulales bacterium]